MIYLNNAKHNAFLKKFNQTGILNFILFFLFVEIVVYSC